jgi:UDP-glucose 4-epimerase
MNKHILVTGGAGFIGSHTALELLESGYDVSVIDNLANSNRESLKRVEQITGKSISFFEMDLLDAAALEHMFEQHSFSAVIHFAGLKAVGESVEKPLLYFENNVSGTVNLCKVMQKYKVKKMVFSSSATVYGDPGESPIPEKSPLSAVNPYGRTKLMIEEILQDLHRSDPEWAISLLRYFNPVGAHKTGLIGEDPNGIPNNLMPYITQVAVGKREHLNVFGGDYDTHDGTGVRDYIHVVDLARGHLKALDALKKQTGVDAYNLGTGSGSSVLDVVKAFEKANNVSIPYRIVDRRPGDAAVCFADASKAARELQWETAFTLEDMCRDAWNWQQKNPEGFSSSE